jgi:hypothetical protein
MIVAAQKDAARIGKADIEVCKLGGDKAHLSELIGILLVVDLVGAGEMAHDKEDFDAPAVLEYGGERSSFLQRYAEARHAGVELQNGRKNAAELLSRERPPPELLERVENRNNVGLGASDLCSGLQPVEHRYLRVVRQQRSEFDRLREMRDEELPAALRMERLGDLLSTEAISVGLDDGGDRCRRDRRRKLLIVPAQCGKVNGQIAGSPSAGLCFPTLNMQSMTVHVQPSRCTATY